MRWTPIRLAHLHVRSRGHVGWGRVVSEIPALSSLLWAVARRLETLPQWLDLPSGD